MDVNVGNFYSTLWASSEAVGTDMLADAAAVVSDLTALHSPFFTSSLPEWLQDSLVNSLSHIRSAWWTAKGEWRQWEAYDCVNVDSVSTHSALLLLPRCFCNTLHFHHTSSHSPLRPQRSPPPSAPHRHQRPLPPPPLSPRSVRRGVSWRCAELASKHSVFYSSTLSHTHVRLTRTIILYALAHARARAHTHPLARLAHLLTPTSTHPPSYRIQVHNDGERHIPYITFWPNATRDKLRAWGKTQSQTTGMIPEQLMCGCTGRIDPNIDSGCGRVMSDVSSMYVVTVSP
jgi:hypothetical protein